MAKVNWGISGLSGEVDGFDRTKQFKPYDGPQPAPGVYHFAVKTAKTVPPTKDKLPQLRLGLALVPRDSRKSERKYEGWFQTMFLPVAANMMWKLVPVLDALGVSGRDFESRTVTDNEGNVQRIGAWRFVPGDTVISAQLKMGNDQNGNPQIEFGWVGPATEDELPDDDEDDAEAFADDYEDDESEDDDESEEDWDEDEDGF